MIVDLGNEQTVRRFRSRRRRRPCCLWHSTVWIEPSSVDRLVDLRWFVTSRVENKGD